MPPLPLSPPKMGPCFPDDGAVANSFGRHHLHEDEARLLYEADYPAPPDMWVLGSWRMSVGGVLVPPPPSRADRQAEIARICSLLSESSRNLQRYARDSNTLWTAYFKRRHPDQLAATNGVEPRGRHNSEGRRQWWGIPGRTLEAVLEHIEGGKSPQYETHCHLPSASPRQLLDAEADEDGVVLLVRLLLSLLQSPALLHTEPALLSVMQEHLPMAADDEIVLKWARDDYVREKMERQRRTLEEIAARRPGHEESDVVILDDSNEEALEPSNPV
ncbi:Homeobox protein KNOX3 [Hordeum vulgare]|nr:Homeobox protein KNOX3 [Hordeum vulgare]